MCLIWYLNFIEKYVQRLALSSREAGILSFYYKIILNKTHALHRYTRCTM